MSFSSLWIIEISCIVQGYKDTCAWPINSKFRLVYILYCVWMVGWKIFFVWGFTSQSRILNSWRRPHNQWRASKFDLSSAPIAIEQRWFLRVQHLLWHGASVYNGHLRGPVTVTPVAERLAVQLPDFTT